MKKYYLLLLSFALTTVAYSQTTTSKGNNAATAKESVQKAKVLISPPVFYGTVSVLFDLDKDTDIKIIIRDRKNKVVYNEAYSVSKNQSFKLDLSALPAGKYTAVVSDADNNVIYNSQIERKND